LNQCKKKRLE